MLWTIIVILVILWLLGFLGGNISPSFPRTGSWIHALIVIAVILIVLHLLGYCELLALRRLRPVLSKLMSWAPSCGGKGCTSRT